MTCFIYSKRKINLICAVISVLIYLIIIWVTSLYSKNIKISAILLDTEDEQQLSYNFEWKLEIPSIGLDAPIAEGTDDQTLNKYIGHFTETVRESGNIGLAGHNRGYDVNYFENIDKLEIGDEIFYTYNGQTVEFIVKDVGIIEETDWSKLEETNDERLTLITCVEDEPNLRRYVQAKRKD